MIATLLTLTPRELSDAIVYGRDDLPGIIEMTDSFQAQKEILEGVVVRLITHLRYSKEMRHIRVSRRRRRIITDPTSMAQRRRSAPSLNQSTPAPEPC